MPTSRLIEDLKAARIARGLSQGEVAARMGTTQSAVARLENAADPRLSTVERYARVVGVDVVYEPKGKSLASLVHPISEALATHAIDDVLRLIIQFVDDFGRLTQHERVAAIALEPASTSSENWDSLLAGLAEHLAVHADLRVPGWTAAPSRFLQRFWFVIEDILGRPAPGLAAYAFAHTPAAFANRGVFMDGRTLESV